MQSNIANGEGTDQKILNMMGCRSWGSPGACATLTWGTYTIVVITVPVVLMTDDVYLGLGYAFVLQARA